MNNTGSRHPDDRRDALTPEERALAERLARLGPQGEPSPALDARILAAARSATAAPAATVGARTTPRRRQRRWPVAFGAAATLVIVGGLGWQLRPVDEVHVEYSEAPRAASGPSADAVAAPLPVQKAMRAPVPPPATPAARTAPASAQATAAAPIEPVAQPAQPGSGASRQPPAEATAQANAQPQPQPKAFASKPAAPAEPPVVFDEPSPMNTPPAPTEIRQLAPPPPAPSPPPAAAPPARPAPASAAVTALPQIPASGSASAAAGAAERENTARENKARMQRAKTPEAAARRTPAAQVASGAVAQPARPANAAAAADASALDRIEVAGARGEDRVDATGDQPLDDQPPASVDSPQVQQAWLQRVRQLVAEGRPDAARDSLREYQRRYPKATLPDDLRTLLDE